MICAYSNFIHKPTKFFFAGIFMFLLIGTDFIYDVPMWSSILASFIGVCTLIQLSRLLYRYASVLFQKTTDYSGNKSDWYNTSFKSTKTDLPSLSIKSGINSFLHFQKPLIHIQLSVISVFILILLAFTGNVNAQTQTFTGNGTFTVPAGVTSITVKCWGGGGAGGGSTNNKNGGSGGGGGGYTTASLGVIPGQSIPVTVGAGGTGSTGAGTNGTAASFLTLKANGGGGGAANRGALGVGGSASGGTTNTIGSNGIVGTDIGGNGGAGANGGAGGIGSTDGVGGNGISPGGGGGGGERSGSTNRAGGNGAAGRVIVTWTCPANAGNLSGTQTICMGESSTFSSAVLGGVWSSGNNGIATIGSSTGVITTVSAGSAVMTYTVAPPGCTTRTATRTLTVNPSSVGGTLTGGTSPLCIGSVTGTMTLTGYTGTIVQWERQVNSGGWTNIWNGGKTTLSESPWSAGVWQYRVAVQNGSCSTAYSSVLSITVDATTVGGWISGSSTPICLGGNTGAITINGSTGSVVRWEKRLNSGTWINITNTLLTYSEIPSSDGTWEYRALLKSGSCSSVYTTSFSVTVNPTLTITLGANPVICRGTTSAPLPYSATTGSPSAYSISFDTAAKTAGMGDVSGWGLSVSPLQISVPSNIAAGVYNGTLNVATTYPVCSSVGYPITITVQNNVIAQPSVITGSTTPCEKSSQTYSVTNVAGVTYTWTFPAGWIKTAGGTTNSITVTVGTGAGNVQVTPSNICGNGTARTLAVTAGLVVSAPATTGAFICIGSTATLSASGAIVGNKYKWYDAATSGNLLKTSADNADNTFVTPVLAATTNYWVAILSAGGCESSRTQVTATYPSASTDDQNAAGTNSWVGHVYDGLNLDTYIGHYTEPELFDQSFGGDYNCFNVTSNSSTRSIYAETFSVRYRMNSNKKGLYVVDMAADDGIRLTVDGALLFDNWVDQAYTSRPLVLMNLNGASSLVYDYYENGGGNRVAFQNLTLVFSNTLSTNLTQSIIVGNTGTAISGNVFGTLPAGITLNGTGYQWTYSTTPSGARTNISGATGVTFTPNASIAPFNIPGTYYIYRNATLSSANNVVPNPSIATNESNASTLTISGQPTITTSVTAINGFNYNVGAGPSAQQLFTISGNALTANIIVTPPTDYEISTTSGAGFVATPITLTQSGGTVALTTIYVRLKAGLPLGSYSVENIALTSTGASTKNVTCNGTVGNVPVITISPILLNEFGYLEGTGPSSQQSFTAGGAYLTNNITVTPPAHYEISKTSGTAFVATNSITLVKDVSGVVATTTIYVRLKTLLTGGIYANENIALTSSGATTQNVVCSGIVNSNVQIWKGGVLQYGYPTLKGAFDAINFGTYTGILEIKINGSTSEGFTTATLYQSGYTGSGGVSNYTTLKIYPTVAGISITGTMAAPLIDLNGADNVTIDGSVNALGSTKSLIINNTNTSTTAGVSSIRFINSAENNNVKYCIIKGSERSTASGVVFFATATAGNGNDGNTIDNNDITGNATARPINAIFSSGTAARENSGNIILNNNIFDFWYAGASSNAIQLGSNTTDFIISRNSFYETTSFLPTGIFNYKMIVIENASGNNFAISNNYLGGQAPLCGGSPLSLGVSGNVQITLDPIQISAGTTSASSIQGNAIQNISMRSSNVAPFRAINATAGTLNIGTEAGNIIGSDIGIGSITVTSTVTTGNVYGIYIASTNNVICLNNIIGSITTANTSNLNATNLFGIYKTATAGITTISSNKIGSAITPNSLNTSSIATTYSQLLYGIYSAGTANTIISTNTIANITNSTSETTRASRLRGILTEGGSNDINNNEVHHLKSGGAANGANYPNTSLIGISQVSNTAGTTQNVSDNSVYNLTNTATVKMEMYGIFYDGPATGTNTISRNFVHSFYINSTDAAYLHGISLYGGAFTASNNIVYLGNTISTGCSMWAMWTNSANSIRIYHNTLYLGGTATTGASNTYAFRSLNAGPSDAIIQNNILWNGRTNSSNVISHYAIYLQSAANTSVNYNDFRFYQQFGIVGATAYASFAEWKTGTGFDINSTEVDPLLVNMGGSLPTDYQTSVPLDGVPGTGILTDYNNIIRSTIAPTMGAWEFFSNPVEVWNGTTFLADYTTLKGAFDKINDGTWKGDLIIKFRGNTIETASAVLNASGTGLSSYSKILIYPVRLGVTVTGSLTGPIVDLNGCDNVTFDGRKDASGTVSEITFSNTSTSNVAGTSTFRFINDATNNIIKYCTIKGSTTDANGGIISFGITSGTTGNDGNTIDNNTITNSADANRPLNAIYSSGTSAKENSGNTISNNNIFDVLNRGTASNGISLGSNTTGETIHGNSFYETSTFTPTANVAYNAININNTSGVNFWVAGNFIGGTATSCGGTSWTKAANPSNVFTAININVGTGTASNIQNNTIQKIVWGNSGAADWTGINISGGDVNIGTSIPNTIGASTGTGSITVTNATTGANVYGINIASSGTVDCQSNIISSITAANAAANATNFYGIKNASVGTTSIINNVIGSITVAASINASSISSGNAQSTYGIYNSGTGTITISSNIIANLKNSTTNATGATSGVINGIFSSEGTNTISNNTIRNLTIANANTSATSSVAVGGIVMTGSTSAKNITGNTIFNLSNTYAVFTGRVAGIYYEGSTSGTNIVSKNFVHSLSTSGTSGASLIGIWIVSGATTYSNNIVNLGSANQNTIYGVYDAGTASQTCNFYFNTIFIGGVVAAGTYNSYAFYSAAANNTRNYQNNIFHNARSRTTGTSTHFAIYYNVVGLTNLTANYNDYFVSAGAGAVLAYYGSNRTTLALFKTAVSPQDANSLSTNPTFLSAGSTIATDYKIGVSLTGLSGLGITVDYGSVPRGTLPTMGAWEANINKWKGSTSNNWNISGNWTANLVPDVDATIIFDDFPVNHCQLDQDRSVTNIINAQAIYRVVTNGHKLTVKGNFNFSNGAQIDASSTNSNIELAGALPQTIPAGIFYENKVYDLTISNINNVTLYGTMRLLHTITSNSGLLDASITTPTVVYAGTAAQIIEKDRYLGDNIYNLSIDNISGVTLSSTAAINVPHDLTITTGVLTVPPGATLTVENFTKLDYLAPMPVPYPLQIDFSSCLVLKSNATSTGSFIHSDLFTGNGTVKVERFMSHTDNWHLYSSPMKDQSVKDFLKYNPEIPDVYNTKVTPNVIIGVGMRDYVTATDVWSPYFVYESASTVDGSIGKGKGFGIRTYNDVQGTGTVDATGIPNTNSVSVSLTRSVAPTDKGWNCIGNPYTSAINIKDGNSAGFLNATNSSNLDPEFVAVYVWDTNNITTSHTTPEYVVLNNATTITSVQVSQGFFVKSKTGGGSVSFTKMMQSPNSGLTFKAADIEWPSIKIVAKNQTLSSSTEIKFVTNTTKGLDPGYDAGMLKANPEFSLYSKLLVDNAVDYALQCLPDQNYDQNVIPVGIDFKAGGELTFTAESINLPSGCQAVLEDRSTKRFTRLDLDGASYTVYLNPDTKGTGRFFLHTSDVISSDNPLENQPFKVYTIGKTVYINGDVSEDAQFFLYSVNGKQLARFGAENQVQNRLDASGYPAGVYLLSIIDKNQKKSVKFVLEN